jgi:hypothetical protein
MEAEGLRTARLHQRGDCNMADVAGMDLRDWFAGQALNGLLSGPNAPKKSRNESAGQYATRVAEEAYLFAEAMLQEKAKQGP